MLLFIFHGRYIYKEVIKLLLILFLFYFGDLFCHFIFSESNEYSRLQPKLISGFVDWSGIQKMKKNNFI